MDTQSSFLGGGWGGSFGGGALGSALRNQGFGLNFNQGFGSRPGLVGSNNFMETQGHAWDQMAQQRALDAAAGNTAAEQAGADRRAQIAANAQTLPARIADRHFRQVLPWLKSQFSSLAGQPAPAAGVGGGGPPITAGPVWNEQQIQQQVNQQRASNDRTMQSQQRQAAGRLAGNGFGTNSPLLQALNAQFAGQNLAANGAADQSIRWNAAQGNANQLLASQQAQEAQYASRQDEAIQRQRNAVAMQNALLSALSGLL